MGKVECSYCVMDIFFLYYKDSEIISERREQNENYVLNVFSISNWWYNWISSYYCYDCSCNEE